MTAAALFRRSPALDSAAGSDRDLLRRFADGRDDTAFAALVHRYGRLVFATCLRVLGHRADAEDAYQASFLVLARRAGSVRSDEKLAGWLHTVAVRTATEVRRMRDKLGGRGSRRAANQDGSAGASPSQTDPLEQSELAAALDEELAKLPDHYRLAVVLCELNGVGRKAAAKELGIAEGTLSSRLAKARKLLAERLAGRGFVGVSAGTITAALGSAAAAKIPTTVLAMEHAISIINFTAQSVADTVVKAMYATKLKTGAMLAILMAALGGVAWTTAAGAGPGQPPGAGPAPAKAKEDKPDPATTRTEKLEAFVAAFREDTEHKAKFDHPVWKRWAKAIGEDRPARELFAQMLQVPDAAKLLDQLEAKPDAAAEVYREQALAFLKLAEKRCKPKRLVPSAGYSAGENTFISYLGTFPGTEKVFDADTVDAERWPLGNLTHQHLWSLGPVILEQPGGGIILRAPRTPEERATSRRIEAPSRKLFLASLANRKHEETIEFGLSSWNADPKVLVPFAKAALANNKLPARARAATFLPLLRANAVECDADIAAFEKDQTVWLEGLSHGDGKTDNLQVRDVAVAVRLLLRKQMLADFGFIRAVPPPGRPLPAELWQQTTVCMTFPDEKSRAAAHEKALAFLKDAPKLKVPEPKAEEPKKEEPAEPLVKLLGSKEFAERESAEKALREIGAKALPAVQAGLKSDNPEVVQRCRRIVAGIHKDAREAFAAAFLADKERTKPFDNPIWKRYVELVGDSAASRAVFAELLKYPDGLEALDTADRDPAQADTIYRAHLSDIAKQVEPLLKMSFSIADMLPGHTADIAAYTLLLGSYRTDATPPEKLKAPESYRYVNGRNYVLAFGDGLKEGFLGKLVVQGTDFKVGKAGRVAEAGPPGTDKVFARLYAHFLAVEPVPGGNWSSADPFGVLRASFDQPKLSAELLAESLPAARRVIADKSVPLLNRAIWVPILRKYGDKSDAARLAALFTEKTPLPNRGGQFSLDVTRVEVREWAVGTALVLRGKNPAEFGFDHFKDRKVPERTAPENFDWAPGKFAIAEPGGGLGFVGGPKERDPVAKEKVLAAAIEWLDGEEKKEKGDPAEALVQTLGSKNFAERETAEKLLRDMGAAAYAAVTAGLKSDNPEIVARCRRLMPMIRAAHLARPESELWKKFAAITGDTAYAKELFLEMASDPARTDILMAEKPGEQYVGVAERLLKAYGEGIDEAWREKTKRVQEQTGRTDITPLGSVISTKLPSRGASTLLYFVGTFAGSAKAKPNVGEDERRHYAELLQYALTAHRKDLKVKDGNEAFPPEARKLFAAWLGNRTDAKTVRCGMDVARTHELAEVLPVARALLADDKRTLLDRAPALHVVALLGTKDDIARVKPFLEDKTVFFHSPEYTDGGKPYPCLVQVRDVAHATIAKLLGAEPLDLGYDFCVLYKTRGKEAFKLDLYHGFTSDEKRAAAHAKVQALLKGEKEPEQPKKDEPAALVNRLGSKDFAEREAAQQKLKELGAAAYEAVTAGLKSASPEVVRRCQKLLPDVRAAWLARPESELWKRFAAVAGDTAEAKKMFVAMAADRDHADILTADKPAEQYAAFVGRLLAEVRKGYEEAEREAAFRTGIIYPAKGWPTRAESVLLFFLGTSAGTGAFTPDTSDRNHVYYSNMIREALNALRPKDGGFPPEAGKLFTAWLAVRRDSGSVHRGFELARGHGFREVLPLARAMLVNDRLSLGERAPALYVIAVLGSKADLDLVRPFLDSDTLFHQTRYTDEGGKASAVVTQVRDIAHAVAGWLLGGEPADLGYEFAVMYKTRGTAVFQQYFYLGFMSDEKRAKAHENVRELLKKAPVPKAVGPAKPKRLPKAAPPSAEAKAAIAAVSTGWTPATIEDKVTEAAKKLTAGEDRAQLYSAAAHLVTNGHLREEFARIRRLADKALDLSRDPVLRWKARSLQASTVYISGLPFAERRRDQADILLAGYAELLVQDLPDADPEWPESPGKRNFGPETPEAKAEREARLEAYQKAREQVEFTKELVFGRKVLLMQLRDAYKPRPGNPEYTDEGLAELRELAAKKMTLVEVKTLIARVLDEK